MNFMKEVPPHLGWHRVHCRWVWHVPNGLSCWMEQWDFLFCWQLTGREILGPKGPLSLGETVRWFCKCAELFWLLNDSYYFNISSLQIGTSGHSESIRRLKQLIPSTLTLQKTSQYRQLSSLKYIGRKLFQHTNGPRSHCRISTNWALWVAVIEQTYWDPAKRASSTELDFVLISFDFGFRLRFFPHFRVHFFTGLYWVFSYWYRYTDQPEHFFPLGWR
jgi:hypothetical protein